MPCNSAITFAEGDWTERKSDAKTFAAFNCVMLLLKKGSISKDLLSIEATSENIGGKSEEEFLMSTSFEKS